MNIVTNCCRLEYKNVIGLSASAFKKPLVKPQSTHAPCSPLPCRLFCLHWHCWCIQMLFSFSLWKCLLSSMISLFYCTCFCCLKCHVCVCTESPLSHSGLSNQEHISLRSPLPCHQWLGKKRPAHPTLFLMYGYQPCPSPNLLNPLASTSDWLTITSCLFTSLFH